MKIGIALGGGAAYGLAHIGVLKVLEKNGIIPDMVAGTSVGSLVGGLYASGCSIEEIEAAAMEFNWMELVNFKLPKDGLVSIDKLENFINKHAKVRDIKETKKQLAVVAVNLMDSREEVFTEGPLSTLIKASCSLPGIFTPALYKNRIYVDGGVLNNVPSNVVKNMGADIVIAVDVLADSRMDLLKNSNIFTIVWTSWMLAIQQHIKMTKYYGADIVITPDIIDINPFDVYKRESIIELGVVEAEKEIGRIQELIKEKSTIIDKIKNIFRP